MPKRKREETEEDRWKRKMKKYEKKLLEKRKRRIIYSSDEERCINEEHLECRPLSPGQPCAGPEDYTAEGVAEPPHGDEDAAGAPPPPRRPAAADAASAAADFADDDVGGLVTPGHAVSPGPDARGAALDEDGALAAAATVSADSADGLPTDSFDPELLRALGEFESDEVEWAENIHEDIAKQYQHILVNGLKKELKEDLCKKYLFSKNINYSKPPVLNPEIGAMLTESSRGRDKRLVAKQEQIGRALSGLGKAITSLLKKESNVSEAIRILNDVGKLMADAHFAETDTRRSVIIPLVDKSLIEPFKDRKRDNYLFGDKLGDLVKDSRGINKTGQLIQAPAPTAATSLNWRGPPPRGRPPRSSYAPPPGRGGPRASFPGRRRAPQPPARPPPPPPPPPPRRLPPLPARSSNYQRPK